MTRIPEEAEIRIDHNGAKEGIRNRLYVEAYPGNAGWSFGTCPNAFDRKNSDDVYHTSNHLHNQDNWDLAKWLMTSNLSGSARDKYFKLKVVSSKFWKIDHRQLTCFRMPIYLGTPTPSSCMALIYCQQVQSGIRLKFQLKGITTKWKKSKHGCEIPLLALLKS